MEPRDQKIYEEAALLWQALFNEPPPVGTDSGAGIAMLALITRRLPMLDYGRLQSPHLRPSTIVGPQQRKRAEGTLG